MHRNVQFGHFQPDQILQLLFPLLRKFRWDGICAYGWINMKDSRYWYSGTWDRQTAGSYSTCAPHTGAGMASYNSFGLYAGTQEYWLHLLLIS